MTILDRPGTSVQRNSVRGGSHALQRRAAAARPGSRVAMLDCLDRPMRREFVRGAVATHLEQHAFAAGRRGGTPVIERLNSATLARPKTARPLHIRGDAPRPQRERWSMTARCKISLTGRTVGARSAVDAVVGFAQSGSAGFAQGGTTGFGWAGAAGFAQGGVTTFVRGTAVEFAQGAVIA
ncbi:hypothetical protein [Nocardia ninae]|nr:hypothetical protein [Nocardia ninae]